VSRAHFPTDYDEYAPIYAKVRSAVPWVVAPLAALIARQSPGTIVLEIGCGTGDYIHSLAELRPDLTCVGFDLSERMLAEARTRASGVSFLAGDAAQGFPAESESAGWHSPWTSCTTSPICHVSLRKVRGCSVLVAIWPWSRIQKKTCASGA
jgi:SAM-dependent methyltransferase